MSLINDALKRAKESQRKNPPSEVSSIRPVETNEKESKSNLALPAVIVFLIVAALALIGLAMFKQTGNKIPAEKLAVAPAAVPKTEIAAAVLPVTNAPAPVPTNPPVVSTPVVAAAPVAPIVTATNPITVIPPAPKPLRLQGIAYDAAHPSAIINGKAVSIGGRVAGMRVTAITPDSVTLAGDGRTKTLVVGEP